MHIFWGLCYENREQQVRRAPCAPHPSSRTLPLGHALDGPSLFFLRETPYFPMEGSMKGMPTTPRAFTPPKKTRPAVLLLLVNYDAREHTQAGPQTA